MSGKRIAIVGRTNVGKSSLFNRLIGRRKAIVYDQPGVTVDRLTATMRDHSFTCIDTAGFQDRISIPECELLLVLFDGQVGIQEGDNKLARYCQQLEQTVLYVVNKVDQEQEIRLAPFYKLGVQPLYGISAKIGIGVGNLIAVITRHLGVPGVIATKPTINVALVGRQNAGKSLLLNKLAHADLSCVSAEAGTTRDSVDFDYRYNNSSYTITDTAGLRRKRHRVRDKVEFLSMSRTLQVIKRAQIVVVVIDSVMGVKQQDLKIVSMALGEFKPTLVVLNKWDLIDKSRVSYEHFQRELKECAFPWANYLPLLMASALTNLRVSELKRHIYLLHANFKKRIATAKLNQAFAGIVKQHPPRTPDGRKLSFYYITQAETEPPTFVIKCNHPDYVAPAYQRYLAASLRRQLDFAYVPLKLLYKR